MISKIKYDNILCSLLLHNLLNKRERRWLMFEFCDKWLGWMDSNMTDFCFPFGPSMALIPSLSSPFQSVKDTQAPPIYF